MMFGLRDDGRRPCMQLWQWEDDRPPLSNWPVWCPPAITQRWRRRQYAPPVNGKRLAEPAPVYPQPWARL